MDIDSGDEDAVGAQEPVATDSSVPNQAVTVAMVTRAASPQPLSSPGSEVALPVVTASPVEQQLDPAPCTPTVSTGSPVTPPSPSVVDTTLIQITSSEDPAEGPAPKISSLSGPSSPTVSTSDSPTATSTPQTLDLTRTFDTANVPSSPTAAPTPDAGRTLVLVTGSASLPTPDTNRSPVPILTPSNLTQDPPPVPSNLTEVPEPVPTNLSPFPDPILTNLTQALEPVPSTLTSVPNLQPKITIVPDSETNPILKPAHSDLALATDAPTLVHCQIPELSPESGLALVPPSPTSGLPQHPGSVAVLVSCLDPAADSDPLLVLSQSSDLISPLPTNVQTGFSSGSGLCSSVGSRSGPLSVPVPVLTPAITIESESLVAPLAVFSPSSPPSLHSPPSLPTPPALSSTSLPAPALLLDPLTALHQSNKGGSSSGHASSLSPSPRATQSPPKQTLFSPCVDVFEPGPPNWDDGEEEQEEEDNDDDEDEDMGADESQYRHRRLTGDSGIEVCRCRVEEEDEEEEEKEEMKEDGRRGGGGDKKGGDLHDSMDCPARGQIITGEGLILCNSTTTTTTPTSEDSGEVVIVMETV